MLTDLVDGAGRRDADAVRRQAHRLKGSCRIVGAVALATASQGVEDAAKTGAIDSDAIDAIVDLARRTCDAAPKPDARRSV